MTQAQPPTFINLPPPGSQPDTPSDMPGTPTSTTTSLSAISTTAIKDGHRGHLPQNPLSRGHAHTASTTSLEAERADRISRLAGLERVSTLRAPPHPPGPSTGAASPSPQTTPTSTTGFPGNPFPRDYPPQHHMTPAYFDNNGQPTADTKMSTVGTASATESFGEGSRTTAGDREERDREERDEDVLSTGYREAGSVMSGGGDPDAMDEDRSVTGYDDRMSDDGSASLVGFGEGAGSTVSGPIYHRRPLPGAMTAAQQIYSLERSNSGVSNDARNRERDRDTPLAAGSAGAGAGGDTFRDPRMMDGVAIEAEGQQGGFTDTTLRGLPVQSQQQQQQGRETAERILQRLDSGETRVSNPLSSPSRNRADIGKFYFEEGKER